MDKNYWQERYLAKDTGWDLTKVSEPLKQYIDQLNNKNLRILIPGAGNAYEASYLLEQNFTQVTVIDIAAYPIQLLKEKHANNISLSALCGDYFQHIGQYDLILEQTFFCALNPNLRSKYANKAQELLTPGGKIVGVLFNRHFEKIGPPFGGTLPEYELLFEPYFKDRYFQTCHNSIPQREGNELFIKLRA